MLSQILYYTDTYHSCSINGTNTDDFKAYLYKEVFKSQIPLILYCNGKLMESKNIPCSPNIIHVQIPLLGGKGGFGANLRKQAHSRGRKTNIDLGACRDLNGNRMRYVNAAIAMKKWRENEERVQALLDEGKEEEANQIRKDVVKQSVKGWYADIPAWFDGIKTSKGDILKSKMKTKLCTDWMKARETRDPPVNAPRYWGCPRGKLCPYAHGYEELVGEEKLKHEKEEKEKKDQELVQMMNEYVNYGSTIESTIQSSVNAGLSLAIESRKKRKLETQQRNSRMLSFGSYDTDLLRKTSKLSPTASLRDLIKTKDLEIKTTNKDETVVSPKETISNSHNSIFLSKLNILTGSINISEDGIIESNSSFPSIRVSNAVIISGQYYFEVHILSEGLIQIGWADSMFIPNEETNDGVGDDSHSWSYDGVRMKKWHNGESSDYLYKWSLGDVIGCMIDMDKKIIQYTKNGQLLDEMFTSISPFGGVFPVCSLEDEESILVNLGQCQFEYDMPYKYTSLWKLTPSF